MPDRVATRTYTCFGFVRAGTVAVSLRALSTRTCCAARLPNDTDVRLPKFVPRTVTPAPPCSADRWRDTRMTVGPGNGNTPPGRSRLATAVIALLIGDP